MTEIARGAGIQHAVTVRDIEEFKQEVTTALSNSHASFIVCKVEESLLHRETPRPTTDLAENKYTFVRYLERAEGKPIAFVGRGRADRGDRQCHGDQKRDRQNFHDPTVNRLVRG